MYSHPYGSSWSVAYRDIPRTSISSNEFEANANHSMRRVLIGLTMVFAPVLILVSCVVMMILAR
jgi:hypothetical protein